MDGNIKDLGEKNLRARKVLFERNGEKIYAVVEIITFIFKPQSAAPGKICRLCEQKKSKMGSWIH